MGQSRKVPTYGGLHVLIVGGGVAALEAVYALRALARDLVYIELLATEPRFFYRPQASLEPFAGPRVEGFEVCELVAAVGAQLTLGELGSVSPDEHVARSTHGMAIPYDALLVACGASPRPVVADAVTFRGPADAERVAAIADDIQRGEIDRITLAIPRPRTWPLPIYELAFGLRSLSDIPIRLVTVEPVVGAVLGRNGSAALTSFLAAHEIEVETNAPVPFERPHGVTVAAPELVANRILGIPADDEGFIPANRFGSVPGLEGVYAAGDVTTYEVKHGSLAAAQADAAAAAIAARAGAELTPAPFRAVVHAHLAIGADSIYVRHDLDDRQDDGTVSREPLWSPAGKIFARHLGPALAEVASRAR